jgi:hypothetical protein
MIGMSANRGTGGNGMKYLSLIPIAIFSVALQGQTGTVGGATPQAGQPVAAASVSAELTKRIDTKNAKQGDEVDARVTSTAKLPDGTELPKGTKLIGKVTEVKAKSKENKSAHLGFNIDHAVLKDGKQVPVMVAVMSVTGPAQSSGEVMAGGGMSPGGAAGSPGASGSSGASGTSGSSMGSSTPAPPSSPMVVGSGQSQPSVAGVLKSAQDRVPVGNMPGVMLSAAGGPGSAGSLDAAEDNINLDSGTKLTLSMAAAGSTAGQ